MSERSYERVLADIIDFCVDEDVTTMPSDEVRAELDAYGIDTDRIVQWVRTTLARAKAKPDAADFGGHNRDDLDEEPI